MNARIERHVDRLATRIMLTIVSTLVRSYNLRLVPESVERIRQVVEEALHEAAIAGRLDVLHPIEDTRPDQSMIDTRPITGRHKTPKKDDDDKK